MGKKKQLEPIKSDIRPLLEEFLAVDEYQPIFFAFAKRAGYNGTDAKEAKNALFTVKDNQIGFNIEGVSELFLEFQLLQQLKDSEPYKTLLVERPEAIQELREIAKKALNKEEITDKDLKSLFKSE